MLKRGDTFWSDLMITGVCLFFIWSIVKPAFAISDPYYALPVPGRTTLTAVFNTPRPSSIYPNKTVLHKALDISCPEGSPVCAAQSGIIIEFFYNKKDNKNKGPLGNYVIIELPNGHRQLYAHLRTFRVMPGQMIGKGEIFAESGNTGRSRGSHLHFAEFDEYGIPVKTTFRFGIRWKLKGDVYAFQDGQ